MSATVRYGEPFHDLIFSGKALTKPMTSAIGIPLDQRGTHHFYTSSNEADRRTRRKKLLLPPKSPTPGHRCGRGVVHSKAHTRALHANPYSPYGRISLDTSGTPPPAVSPNIIREAFALSKNRFGSRAVQSSRILLSGSQCLPLR
jgi:hypothetical protein